MLRQLLLLLLFESALLLQLPARSLHHRQMHTAVPRRARLLVLNEDAAQAGGEEPAAAAEAEPAEAAEADADPQAAAKAEKKALRDAIAELEAKLPKARGNLVAALDAKKDAGENGYMLLAANFERARVQAREELKSQKAYGNAATLKSLLSFSEEFAKLQAEAPEGGDDGAAAIHKYYGGICKQSQQLLDSWGVTTFDAEPGTKVDIFKHEVVERWTSEEVAEGSIIAGVEQGYMMGEAIVRPAKVYASLGPESANEDEPEAAEAAPVDEAADEPPAE